MAGYDTVTVTLRYFDAKFRSNNVIKKHQKLKKKPKIMINQNEIYQIEIFTILFFYQDM